MTKAQFITFVQSIPVPDDSILNVSVNNEDIDPVKAVGWSTPDENNTVQFCINFDI